MPPAIHEDDGDETQWSGKCMISFPAERKSVINGKSLVLFFVLLGLEFLTLYHRRAVSLPLVASGELLSFVCDLWRNLNFISGSF